MPAIDYKYLRQKEAWILAATNSMNQACVLGQDGKCLKALFYNWETFSSSFNIQFGFAVLLRPAYRSNLSFQ